MTTHLTDRSNVSPPTAAFADPFTNSTCLNATKFGDDDLASKRRKDSEDEYNTVFTKKLAESQLNSTLNFELGGAYDSGPNSLDFKGGPVTDHDETDFGQKSITSNPSDTSFGFHNTFSVLQKQIQTKKQPRLSQRQIEFLLHENNGEAVKNPIYVDIPISDECYLRAISDDANGPFEDGDSPSLFELELEAMQRVKQMLVGGTTGVVGGQRHFEVTKSNAAEHVRESNPSLLEDFYQQDGGEYSEYVYHVARSKEGQVYLRVVRSLLVDKGKLGILTIFFYEILIDTALGKYFLEYT